MTDPQPSFPSVMYLFRYTVEPPFVGKNGDSRNPVQPGYAKAMVLDVEVRLVQEQWQARAIPFGYLCDANGEVIMDRRTMVNPVPRQWLEPFKADALDRVRTMNRKQTQGD